MDIFTEYIVKKAKGAKEFLMMLLILAGVVLMFLFVLPLISPLFGNFLLIKSALYVGTIYLAYYAFTFLNVEYEYILTESTLDIDIIWSQRKRKRLLSVDAKSFEIMAPTNNGELMKEYSGRKVLDYSSYRENPRNYFAVCERNGEAVCLIFEPNESMLKNIKKFIPNKVVLDENI